MSERGLSKQNDHAGELRECEEVFCMTLVTSRDAAETKHPGDKSFDVPSAPVSSQRATILGLRLSAVFLMR